MAYFAQAGQGRAFTQGDVQEQETAASGAYGQGYAGGYQAQVNPAPGYQPQGYHAQGYQPQGYAPQGYPAEQAYAGPGAEPQYTYAEPDEFGYVPPAPGQARAGMTQTLRLLGAAASVALVAGVGVWGYKLVMRDVSGVPVVRAAEGPMREAPANPGGIQADHQGLAVNAVAAQGSAAAPADRLTLAPAAIELTEDDKPQALLTAQVSAQQAAATAQPSEDAGVSEAAVASFQNGDIDALVAELAAEAESLSAATPASAPAIVQPEPLRPALADAAKISPALLNAPGVKRSLRPPTRPARITRTAAAAPAVAASRATVEVDPATLPPGTRLAQLGAYESAEIARAEWDRIYARFSDFLAGKQRVIQRAESGGRTFYRLRAMGFEGLSDTRRFCSALVAGDADCIPVTTR
ncbi:SPOR domain-containing protein [Leisingera sp. XS_AS12]|uniref:SPOR domain-containing protein n=1 Tax=Leisingera sp. XS_AS12 TaxID=3241294 RepID=UPI0035110231